MDVVFHFLERGGRVFMRGGGEKPNSFNTGTMVLG